MDIKDVGVNLDRSSRSEPVKPRVGSAKGKATAEAKEVFFENSGRLGQVRALIDSLVQVPDVRPEAVERGKSLLESGALDSPEAAAKAAEGLFEAI